MYERKYWWWHAVVLVRRWAFILTCSLLSPIGYFQVGSLGITDAKSCRGSPSDDNLNILISFAGCVISMHIIKRFVSPEKYDLERKDILKSFAGYLISMNIIK